MSVAKYNRKLVDISAMNSFGENPKLFYAHKIEN